MSIFKFFTRRQSETLTDNFAGGGYLEYVALLTQTGTSAPVATVLNSTAPNYLGAIIITRLGMGSYLFTKTGALTQNKTTAEVWSDTYDINMGKEIFVTSTGGGNAVQIVSKFMNYDGGWNGVESLDISSMGVKVFVRIRVYN